MNAATATPPTTRRQLRVGIDLDGTLVGFVPDGRGGEVLALRPEAPEILDQLARMGHTLVLWTFGTRGWWNAVVAQFPVLGRFFREVHTREDLEAVHYTVAPDRNGLEPVKDVRAFRIDLLVDNDPRHREWALRHGLAEHYHLVPTFGRG